MPTTYREIPTKLAAGEPFQGGSMSAHRHGNVYVVMSYGTTIVLTRCWWRLVVFENDRAL